MNILHIPPISKSARRLLRICLQIIILSAVTLLLSYLEARAASPLLANINYPPMLEYIIASITITVGGFLLLTLVEREVNQ